MALLHAARRDAGDRRAARLAEERHPLGPHDRRARGARSRRAAAPGSRGSPAWRPCRCTTPPPSACATTRSRVLRPLQGLAAAPLAEWLAATLEALRAGARPVAAGRRRRPAGAAQALLLDLEPAERRRAPGRADRSRAEPGRVHALGRRASSSRPPSAGTGVSPMRRTTAPMSIVTPLARAMLRPFAAVVLPGATRRLGAWPVPDALAAARGRRAGRLPTPAERRGASGSPSPSCCASPPLTLLRRPATAPSRWRRARSSSACASRCRPQRARASARGPIRGRRSRCRRRRCAAPSAIAPGLVARPPLGDSACEALRDCPYRFFAQRVLRLRDADELEAEAREARLRQLAARGAACASTQGRAPAPSRPPMPPPCTPPARVVLDEHGLDAADFLPFAGQLRRLRAALPRVAAPARRSRRALAARRAVVHAEPARGRACELYGIVDRIDGRRRRRRVLELIDYKTGSAQPLEGAVREPARGHAARLLRRAGGRGERPSRCAPATCALDGARGARVESSTRTWRRAPLR